MTAAQHLCPQLGALAAAAVLCAPVPSLPPPDEGHVLCAPIAEASGGGPRSTSSTPSLLQSGLLCLRLAWACPHGISAPRRLQIGDLLPLCPAASKGWVFVIISDLEFKRQGRSCPKPLSRGPVSQSEPKLMKESSNSEDHECSIDFLKTRGSGPLGSDLSRVPTADRLTSRRTAPISHPLGSARAGGRGDTEPGRGAGVCTPWRLLTQAGTATQGPGLSASLPT